MNTFVSGRFWVGLLCAAAGLAMSTRLSAVEVPNGLYVVSGGTNILRFDVTTGAFIEKYVDLGAGAGARGLHLGPNLELWAATANGIISIDGTKTVTSRLPAASPNYFDLDFFSLGGTNYLYTTRPAAAIAPAGTNAVERRVWNGSSLSGPTSMLDAPRLARGVEGFELLAPPNPGVPSAFFATGNESASYSLLRSDNVYGSSSVGSPIGGYLDIEYNPVTDKYYTTLTPEFGGSTSRIDIYQYTGSPTYTLTGFNFSSNPLLIQPRMLTLDRFSNSYITQVNGNVLRFDGITGAYTIFVPAGTGGLADPWGIAFVIPEPSTTMLLAVGGLALLRRRHS